MRMSSLQRDIMLIVLGAVIGFLLTTVSNYLSSNRSEQFTLDITEREDAKVARKTLLELFGAIGRRNDEEVNHLWDQLHIETLNLRQFRELLLPLGFAILTKQMNKDHYLIQRKDETTVGIQPDVVQMKDLEDKGWREIDEAVVDLKATLIRLDYGLQVN